ncbi:MAG: Rieske (2Fe-2S) protein [Actinobacteria bacterium]|jgi:nitrite reductase/ring-hydroxylating ferredoxin subunit|nr:Rieske (2Fe-2S) protein [Actinomycetota bacterium]
MTRTLGPLTDFDVDKPTQVTIDDEKYLVIRRSQSPDEVCVVRDRCPHAGLSLSRGPRGGYENGVITCPWHNSRFDVCSGENLDWTPGFAGFTAPGWSRKLIAMGKSPAPLTVLSVSVQDGQVVIDE